MRLKNPWPYIARFFLPWACAGCRGALASIEDTGFCGACWLAIPRIQGLVCQACGVPLIDGSRYCFGCRQAPPQILVRAACEFRGVIRPAIHRFKYSGRKSLSKSFGVLLRYAWSEFPELQNVHGLVPVPLYDRHQAIRGYNQADLLAETLALETGLPVLPLLLRTRQTRSQIELDRVRRRDNVRSAFALQPLSPESRERLRGLSFLLIDDVCTTASTLAECASVLRHAGAGPVKALVLARDL